MVESCPTCGASLKPNGINKGGGEIECPGCGMEFGSFRANPVEEPFDGHASRCLITRYPKFWLAIVLTAAAMLTMYAVLAYNIRAWSD